MKKLLPQLENKPKWIVLENVKGFYGSEVHGDWCACLKECGYSYRDCLMNPVDLGIPNNRRICFMICELSQRFSGCCRFDDDNFLGHRSRDEEEGSSNAGDPDNNDPSTITDVITTTNAVIKKRHPLRDYIQHDLPLNKSQLSQYFLSDEQLRRDWAADLSIVTPADTITNCFTAGYGRILHSVTGSVLLYDQKEESIEDKIVDRDNMMRYAGRIRKFTLIH